VRPPLGALRFSGVGVLSPLGPASPLPQTLGTKAVDFNLHARHVTPLPNHGGRLQGIERPPREVLDPTAFPADQMMMGIPIGIEVASAIGRAEPDEDSMTLEEVERPIHRIKRQCRHARAKPLVDILSRRMARAARNGLKNLEPLRRRPQAGLAAQGPEPLDDLGPVLVSPRLHGLLRLVLSWI